MPSLNVEFPTDIERILTNAAKIANVKIERFQWPCEYYSEWGVFPDGGCDHTDFWNPYVNDADAFRLLDILISEYNIGLSMHNDGVLIESDEYGFVEVPYHGRPYTAPLREAITYFAGSNLFHNR